MPPAIATDHSFQLPKLREREFDSRRPLSTNLQAKHTASQ
jgi:hypothetical protein